MRIEIDGNEIECDVQYGKRKKLLIQIDSIGLITVKAPKNTSEEIIKNAIINNWKQIKERLDEIIKLKEKPMVKSYGGQGKFMYLGKEYFLHELIGTSELSEDELKTKLKKFYILSCKKIIDQRIKIYQEQLKVKPKVIEIVESKNHWGSCNSNKKITFNYRLAMAPVEVIDYVVVHELCHILHMNHDRSFWRRVGSILPDYKERQKYLERYGYDMTL
ncbi:M48 family metallopeptidase [Alkaliphilus sp. B6464]|uniref:M48 family metallopeptidase n=1 Tax=Alkaliphilus sp. B6464 TaxID=2731219 RepID=UPI001BA592BD|nr:SprT family zinc-dependent metalloprotease [Alkaliphilus sp. B6464]QUH20641.1 M48 family metallopeptidase [Alkaliphilus sp. B6464]